jgi:hypothetical protein
VGNFIRENLDYDTIHSELHEFGLIEEAIPEIGLAVADLVADADRRHLNYVVNYSLRHDRHLTVDVLHYQARPPRFKKNSLSLPKKVCSQLLVFKNFPPKGYTIRFVTLKEAFECLPELPDHTT